MIFKPTDRERALVFLDKQFERKKHVKIELVTESRTLSQNAYCWLCFTHIAFETGNDKNDIYYYYLDKFPKHKEVIINGEIHLVRISLSSFTKEQTSQFIEEFTADARCEGYDVPEPEEQKTLEMLNYYKQKGMI